MTNNTPPQEFNDLCYALRALFQGKELTTILPAITGILALTFKSCNIEPKIACDIIDTMKGQLLKNMEWLENNLEEKKNGKSTVE